MIHARPFDSAQGVVGTPPAGEQPLEWILLTNVPAPDLAAAAERVDWYACRPVVEEFHKAMKTGCGVELPQFATAHALAVTIALLPFDCAQGEVVATQLLRLRGLARNPDAADRPAADVVDQVYVDAVAAWRYKLPPPGLTVRELCMALAKLGGHLNRKGDGPPGWLALWRGWTLLQPIVDGMLIERRRRCVQT